jgi:repressor LexA
MPYERKGTYDRCIEGLTIKQADMLLRIVEFLVREGRTPTYREIMEVTGIKSTSNVAYYIDIFEEAGYIKRVEDHFDYKVIGMGILPPYWYYSIKEKYQDTYRIRSEA